MKSSVVKPYLLSVLYFIVTFCSKKDHDSNTLEMENLTVSEITPTFSFNKKNFNDFQCNFSNEVLSPELVKKPPFYHNKPARNVILTFSLFFQYSLIKQNEEFKNAFEGLYKLYLSEMHNLKQNPNEFIYNEQDFMDHLKRLDGDILKILKGKNVGMIKVIEEDGRIVISQNNSSSNFTLKLIEKLKDDKWDASESKEIEETMIEFYILLKEMYLQDLLEVGFLKSLRKAYKESKKKGKEQKKDESVGLLLRLYAKLRQIFKEDVNKKNDIIEKQKLSKFSDVYSSFFTKMYVNERFSTYLYEIISKSRAKCFYNNFNEPSKDDVFKIYSETYKRNIFTFIELLKNNLKDTKKIKFEGDLLTDESFNNLLKNCLELVV